MRKDNYNWEHIIEMEIKRMNGEFIRSESKVNCKPLSKKEIELVLEFIDDCKADGLSKPRIVQYLRVLRLSKRFLKTDFDKATKKDMKKAIAEIEGSELSEWTKQGYRIAFKKFFKWYHVEKLNQKLDKKEYPEIVNWYDTTIKNGNGKLPEDMLTESDVKFLINKCDTIRDKAFISILWDSGCRIGEILNLKIKNLVFDKYGAQVIVSGKTGSRRVRLIPSVPYLANLKENHPLKDDPEAFLFVGDGTRNKNERLSYIGASALLSRIKKRSGIKKKINAHNFRHSRATYFASRVKEAVLKELFGWTQKSQMVATYIHLSGKDVDKEVRKAQGIEIEEEREESKLKPIECVRCGTQNPATNKYCLKCSMTLNITEARKIIQNENKELNEVKSEIDNLKEDLKEYFRKEVIKEIKIELGVK